MKFLPKGGGRNVSVISVSGSHECNIPVKPVTAVVRAQYLRRRCVLMQCRGA